MSPEVSSLRTLRRLLVRFRPVAWAAAGVFVLLLLRTVVDVFGPYVLGKTIDQLAGMAGVGGELPASYTILVVILGALALAKLLLWYASQVAAASVGQDLENHLRADLFAHVMRLRFTYHDENRSGKTIARVTKTSPASVRYTAARLTILPCSPSPARWPTPTFGVRRKSAHARLSS